MNTVNNVLLCNNFGGIKRINSSFSSSGITASDIQNVELFDTGINSGVGIRTMKGNSKKLEIPNEKIINIFSSIQQSETYLFIHTETESEGKIYLYNPTSNSLLLKCDNLSLTGISCGVDFTYGWSDLFVFSNGENLVYISLDNYDEHGNLDEVHIVTPVDVDGINVKGLGLSVFDNRLWIFNKTTLWYSRKVDCFDFSSDDSTLSTSAGKIDFVKNITAITPFYGNLIVFHSDSSSILSVDSSGSFSVSNDSPGGCAGVKAFVIHGSHLYFYDDTKKSIFVFSQTITADKLLNDSFSKDIQEEFFDINEYHGNMIVMKSVILPDRNEFWFIMPSDNEYSSILIYDAIHAQWVKRKSQKISSIEVFKNNLFSSSDNKLLIEYDDDKFDEEFIPSFYKCTPLNLGIDNSMKILYMPPRVTLDMTYLNDFMVRYINNYDTLKKIVEKHIYTKNIRDLFYWDSSNWDSKFIFKPKETNSIKRLPTSCFQTLEINFFTNSLNQEFAIKNIEFSRIKVKQL